VPLENGFGEEIFSTMVVHLKIEPVMDDAASTALET